MKKETTRCSIIYKIFCLYICVRVCVSVYVSLCPSLIVFYLFLLLLHFWFVEILCKKCVLAILYVLKWKKKIQKEKINFYYDLIAMYCIFVFLCLLVIHLSCLLIFLNSFYRNVLQYRAFRFRMKNMEVSINVFFTLDFRSHISIC